jgi:chondroitin-sulfate-ABC endolyase/exolyase
MDAFDNGYYVADSSSLKLRRQSQQSPKPNGIDVGSGDVALAWIDHGVSPAAAQYEYAVKAQTTVGQIEGFTADPTYNVMRKDALAHVAEDSLTSTIGYAIFDASAQFEYGYLDAVSSPSLVMIKPVTPGRLRMSIADPDLHIDDGGNPGQTPSGLKDDNILFNESTGVTISVTLRGKWQMPSGSPGATLVQSGPAGTELEFYCIDGKAIEIELVRSSTDMEDFAVISANFMAGCIGPLWCDGADMNISGWVDPNDVRAFAESWIGI